MSSADHTLPPGLTAAPGTRPGFHPVWPDHRLHCEGDPRRWGWPRSVEAQPRGEHLHSHLAKLRLNSDHLLSAGGWDMLAVEKPGPALNV